MHVQAARAWVGINEWKCLIVVKRPGEQILWPSLRGGTR
jgi:hypothetical protein